MPDDAVHLRPHALPQLRQPPVRGRIGRAEQGEKADRRAVLQELSCHLESDRAARAEAGDDARTLRTECADLGGEVRGEILDARERLALAVETGRLEPVQRLIVAQVSYEDAIAEDVPVVSTHREHGRVLTVRLERHDGARHGERLRGAG